MKFHKALHQFEGEEEEDSKRRIIATHNSMFLI